MFLLFANMATRKFKTMDVAGILFDGIVLVYIVRPRLESSSISPQNFPEPVLWVQYTSKESWIGSWGEGIVGCVISPWVLFWLCGGKVIRSQPHQPSGSNQSGVYLLVCSI